MASSVILITGLLPRFRGDQIHRGRTTTLRALLPTVTHRRTPRARHASTRPAVGRVGGCADLGVVPTRARGASSRASSARGPARGSVRCARRQIRRRPRGDQAGVPQAHQGVAPRREPVPERRGGVPAREPRVRGGERQSEAGALRPRPGPRGARRRVRAGWRDATTRGARRHGSASGDDAGPSDGYWDEVGSFGVSKTNASATTHDRRSNPFGVVADDEELRAKGERVAMWNKARDAWTKWCSAWFVVLTLAVPLGTAYWAAYAIAARLTPGGGVPILER